MITSKSVRLSAGVVGIVALLAATDVLAQSTCSSHTTNHAAGNFVVNVEHATLDGRDNYTYTMTSPTGKNPNKWFTYVKRSLETDLVATMTGCTPPCGQYLNHNEVSGGFPPAEVWRGNSHNDGVAFTSVAIDKVITLDVSQRFKPAEGVTTVILGIGSTFEHCGPILGPTTPAAPGFEGNPVKSTSAEVCFNNGCCYFMTTGPTDNIVNSVIASPATPFATEPPFEACTVDNNADCAGDLNIPFCPPHELGRPPIQTEAGGTCYSPKNIKYSC